MGVGGALAERYPKSFVTYSYFWDLTFFLSGSKSIKAFYPRVAALRGGDIFDWLVFLDMQVMEQPQNIGDVLFIGV